MFLSLHLRALLGFSVLLAVPTMMVVAPSEAATPALGTITTTSGPITYTSGPFFVSNASGELVDEGEATTPTCSPAATFPCDNFALTVTLPAGYSATYPGTVVRASMSFTTATGINPDGAEEFDLYIYDSAGNLLSDSIANDPAVINIPVQDGTSTFTVQIVPTQAAGDSAMTSLTLMPGAQPVTTPPATSVGTPRYQLYDPTSQGQGEVTGGGEDNIGFDLITLNIMTMNEVGNVYDVKPPELLPDPENNKVTLPESCQAQWTNVSNNSGDTTQVTSLDPILWTDSASGRTFQSNVTAGATAFFSYTDNDGTTWTPASAAPPDGGVDHETIATGPYPAGSPFATVASTAGFNYAAYYCSQAEVPDFCQRSDSGGSTFGPGVPITNGVTNTCTGIHGHAKVSPYDGSVYVPIRNCGALQGGSVSTDAGLTWNQFSVTGSTGNSSNFDPSIALASDGTGYFCYVGSDAHPHAAVSPGSVETGGAPSDGASWRSDTDLGASMGIQSAVYVEAVAGDPGRAACGFLATTTSGGWSVAGFPGVWKLYIASTFDGGHTWTTVDTDPNLIVQAAGSICNQGTTCSSSPNYRNLLDFNEVTKDEYGHILFAFDQGCVSAACQASPTVANNDLASDERIMRQSGGMSLYAKYDNLPNYAALSPPKPPCLEGTRSSSAGNLSWSPGDSGGSAITGYKIYRSTTMGGEVKGSPIATLQPTSGAPPTSYNDTTINSEPAGPVYYTVTGINSAGEGQFSNEIQLGNVVLSTGGDICIAPGDTLSTTSTGTAATTGIPYAEITTVSVDELDPSPTVQPTVSVQSTAITFTIALNSFESLPEPPPNTSWTVEWNMPVSAPGTSTDGTSQTVYVSFDTYSDPTGEASFGYIDNTTTPKDTDAQCTAGTTLGGTCQASAVYSATNNTITITLDTHAPIPVSTLATGSTLSPFSVNFNTKPLPTLTMVTAVVEELAGAGGTGLIETLDTSSSTSYTVSGNYFCRPDAVPLAALILSPGNGVASASGLAETLDASASSDTSADTIASYTFMPTSASASTTQSSSMFNYTYPVGIYTASVSVTNDRGLASKNSATASLTVSPLPPTNIVPSDGTSIGSVNLSWTATASELAPNGTSVYNIYYSTSSGGESNPSNTNAAMVMAGVNGTSSTITGLTPGVTYYFTIYTLAGPGNTLPSVSSEEVSLVAPTTGASTGGGTTGSNSGGSSSGSSSGGSSSGGSSTGGSSSGGTSTGGSSTGGSSTGGNSSGGTSTGGASSGGSSTGGKSTGGSSGGTSTGGGSTGGSSTGGSSTGGSSTGGNSSGGMSTGGASSGGSSTGGKSTGGSSGGTSTGGTSTGGSSTGGTSPGGSSSGGSTGGSSSGGSSTGGSSSGGTSGGGPIGGSSTGGSSGGGGTTSSGSSTGSSSGGGGGATTGTTTGSTGSGVIVTAQRPDGSGGAVGLNLLPFLGFATLLRRRRSNSQ